MSDVTDVRRVDEGVALRPGPMAPSGSDEAGFVAAVTTGEPVRVVVARLPLDPLAAHARVRRLIDAGVLVAVPCRAAPPARRLPRAGWFAVPAVVAAALVGWLVLAPERAPAPLAAPSPEPVPAPLGAAAPVPVSVPVAPPVPAAGPVPDPVPEAPSAPEAVAPSPAAAPARPAPARSAPVAPREAVVHEGFDAAELRVAPTVEAVGDARVFVGAAGDLPVTLRVDGAGGLLVYEAPEGRRERAVTGRVDDEGIDLRADDGTRIHATLAGERLLGRCWLGAAAPRQCLLVPR